MSRVVQHKKVSNSIQESLKKVDLLQFAFFYTQLEKLKSNRASYHIEFVLKSCYPELTSFKLSDIEAFIADLQTESGTNIPVFKK